ncbi:MAG: hypothetical protein WC460_01395 [Patescibacteria group bacterium]
MEERKLSDNEDTDCQKEKTKGKKDCHFLLKTCYLVCTIMQIIGLFFIIANVNPILIIAFAGFPPIIKLCIPIKKDWQNYDRMAAACGLGITLIWWPR